MMPDNHPASVWLMPQSAKNVGSSAEKVNEPICVRAWAEQTAAISIMAVERLEGNMALGAYRMRLPMTIRVRNFKPQQRLRKVAVTLVSIPGLTFDRQFAALQFNETFREWKAKTGSCLRLFQAD